MEPFFIGIDIGTQGARVVLIDAEGNLVEQSEQVFPLNQHSRQEQSPDSWWQACLHSLKEVMKEAGPKINKDAIRAISVTSTSGTVLPLDENNKPLHPALMYSDQRSAVEAILCQNTAQKYHSEGYTGFNTSSGLSKIVWFGRHFPEKKKQIRRWVHAADYIIGKLSGCWGITDYTNALKSGYDVEADQWPAYLFDALPLKEKWLPSVVSSGTVLGTLKKKVAAEAGLPPEVKVAAGITDGCASQIAAGAMDPGNWNTTIGTTMVIKGVTKKRVVDPLGRFYCHRHPAGYWMPGGASNTGADWITQDVDTNLDGLNKQARKLFPTAHIAYPLRQKGERFPFIAKQARGFEPEGLTKAERFVASMEGVAYVERYAFEMISKLSGEEVQAVYTAGGGSNSEPWLHIRSNVLGLPIHKMKHVSGAFGAAILAASQTYFSSIIEATNQLTQIEKEIHPKKEYIDHYQTTYRMFLDTLQKKEYLPKEDIYA